MVPSPIAVTVYLALGSNLGDRAALIAQALARLEAAGVVVRARSPLFETDPVTPDPQPPYLNAAARVETRQTPDEILGTCLAIERALGRQRLPGHAQAARTIDLDVLLYGTAIIDRPGLVIPHPRLLDRPFVRIPLATVAEPGLRHPVTASPLDTAPPDPAVRPATW